VRALTILNDTMILR
jgi:hypothetical protein